MPRKKQRRSRGEGSYFQRKDGRWCWKGVVNGQAHYIYGKKGEPKSAVKEEHDRVMGEIANGMPRITGKGTVAEFMVSWLATVRRNRRPKTYASYESVVRLHILPVIGEMLLRKVQPEDIESVLAKLDDTPRMRAYALIILKNALGVAMKRQKLLRNVAALVDAPKVLKKEIKPYSDEEWDKYLAAIDGHRYRALFILATTFGLRKGEVSGIPWKNVEFNEVNGRETVTIKIHQQVQRVGYNEKGERVYGEDSLQVLPVKTEKGRRILTGGPVIAALLREAKRIQLEMRLAAGEFWNNEYDLVFTTGSGRPMEPREILEQHYQNAKKAGIRQDVTFHGLRHQAGTDMLAAGMNLKKVSELLGHSSTKVTADIYIHPRMTEDDVALLEKNAQRRKKS